MALPGESIENLTEIHLHPVAIQQCNVFLEDFRRRGVKIVETSDTALSAKRISDNKLKGIGALASSLASEIYNLEILAEETENENSNFTRFLMVTDRTLFICDPSHIGGKRTYLLDISQEAMDLNYDGLMIESHIDPDNAWSDKAQQVTPGKLCELIDQLVLRSVVSDDAAFVSNIDELHSQIDIYDDQLLDLLERRMQVAETIGQYKKQHGITILQSNRWQEIVNKAMRKGSNKGLSSEFISIILKAIHQESIVHQMKIMNDEAVNNSGIEKSKPVPVILK